MRVPASYCGIFGFRPSHGVVSTSGVTPMAQSFDTVGKYSKFLIIQIDNLELKRMSNSVFARFY